MLIESDQNISAFLCFYLTCDDYFSGFQKILEYSRNKCTKLWVADEGKATWFCASFDDYYN
jgi:hypothetical protein